MLNQQQATHLIISVIFNQSQPSNKVFGIPGLLLKRLDQPCFDLPALKILGQEALCQAIAQKPALHRFPRTMAENLFQAIGHINRNYGSDPRKLWQDAGEEELLERLMGLRGIGKHKATQCLLYLEALGEIQGVSGLHFEYMANHCAGFFDHLARDLAILGDAQP